MKYKSGGSLLDLGCSAGGFLASVERDSWNLFGVEQSEVVANNARLRTGAEVFVGDVLDAPFPDGNFDAVTCFHVFEHLYEPRQVLERIINWLKPGGILYAMMPNIDSAAVKIFGSYWYGLELPRHLYHFSPLSLGRLSDAVGFEVISLTTHREVFVEPSVRYIVDAGFRRLGFSRQPMADAKPASLPWKVIRKSFRLTALPVLDGLASFAGDGESIHAIFRKPLAAR